MIEHSIVNMVNATPALFEALSVAQGAISNPSKNARNSHFQSGYSDLAEVLSVIRVHFSAAGLSLIQAPAFTGQLAEVTTIVGHKDGGFITFQTQCVPARTDPQGLGSCFTYLRRYGASAAAGIHQEDDDDDGVAAMHNQKPAPIGNHPKAPIMNTPPPTISADQEKELRDIITEIGADESVVLEWMKVGELKELKAASFAGAKSRLEQRLEAIKAAKEADADDGQD